MYNYAVGVYMRKKSASGIIGCACTYSGYKTVTTEPFYPPWVYNIITL